MPSRRKSLLRRPVLCLLLFSMLLSILLLMSWPLWLKLLCTLAFTALLASVWQHNIQHLTAHREELRMVANSVEDAMWALQPKGSIEWMNPAFLTIFHATEDQRYQHYQEVIKSASVLDFIGEFISHRRERMLELVVEDQYFLITGSYNHAAERFVFIMQNIDIIRQTERMKRDFMVNVAHELRTPLTAIKGFTLALEEDFSPDNKRYLKIIKNHTDRLIQLISDFQTLAKLERMPALDIQPIDLQVFMDNILAMYQPTIAQEGLELIYRQQTRQIMVNVDPFKFEQIFINLIDNALHYTSSGNITITARQENEQLRMTVSDTGSGIPAEHLPRIFERFYVADPSRNKKSSGTGLGLAIVKHAVKLHHGNITVSSHPGQGTTFTLSFPCPSWN